MKRRQEGGRGAGGRGEKSPNSALTKSRATANTLLSTQHSALSTQHSALSTQHSALSTQPIPDKYLTSQLESAMR
ncbi:hypothetical protein ACQFX9_28785 [Aliinostoc sp. HNIBRCY26]|uniref:hypothetical protein n=1 Tax=Aliinostoc sp. HNIBRCY26 TaxID=3418997 RepID=UPI003D04EDBE